MALDKESVKLAISILKKINKFANVVKYERYDKSISYVDTNFIYCVGEMSDDGYENVITNIENMTSEQIRLWEELKDKVPNSSYMDKLEEKDFPSYSLWLNKKEENITRIGWF